MAKRKRVLTQKIIDRKIKNGDGSGRLSDYTPWLTIQEAETSGLATRALGWKTGRKHHFLTKLKLQYFFLLEWSAQVIDIREVYPLDLSETKALAKEIGVSHPVDKRSGTELVITTDFLLTLKQSIGTQEAARTVLYEDSLNSARIVEQLEIQRRYWEFRNINWGIITERDIDLVLVSNIEWIYSYLDVSSLKPLSNNEISAAASFLKAGCMERAQPLINITNSCDKKFNFPEGSALSVVRHLIAKKFLAIDMYKPIKTSEPVNILGEK